MKRRPYNPDSPHNKWKGATPANTEDGKMERQRPDKIIAKKDLTSDDQRWQVDALDGNGKDLWTDKLDDDALAALVASYGFERGLSFSVRDSTETVHYLKPPFPNGNGDDHRNHDADREV